MARFCHEKTIALHLAAMSGTCEEVRRLLTDPEVDVNHADISIPSRDCESMTPFLQAVSRAKPDIVRCFLESDRSIDFNKQFRMSFTTHQDSRPLHRAMVKSDQVFRMLLDDPRIDIKGHILFTYGSMDYVREYKTLLAHNRFDTALFAVTLQGMDPIKAAEQNGSHQVAELFRAYLRDPEGMRAKLKMELGEE